MGIAAFMKNADKTKLESLGTVSTPDISDVFVATIEKEQTSC